MASRRGISQIYLLLALSFVPSLAKPIVDPGLFVIQGVTSCINGTGYCMLGSNCSVDVDFLPDPAGGHCNGLREAFTPKIDFVCCRYNPLGKATSKPPTTTINPYTITDVFSLIDAHVDQQENNEDEFPEDFNPENVIDIVGVATDFTGIVGLITRPWTGTFPTKPTTPTTTPMTSSMPTTAAPPPSPATPLDVDQVVHVLSTESATEMSVETTENYNEIPTDTTEHSVLSQQNSETTDHQEETSSADPISQSTTEEDIDEAEDEVEAARVTSGIQSPPPSSPSPADLTATTSKYPIGDNIVFPDNPIVSKFPILETEALEAETESIINILGDAIIPNPFPVPFDRPESNANSDGSNSGSESQASASSGSSSGSASQESASSGSVPGSVSQVPVSGGSSVDSVNQLTGTVNEEHPDIYPQKPSDDYDYYGEYQDQQHLLQPINKNICGFKGFKNYLYDENSSRILGGVIASTVEWCWVAAIMERRQSGDKYICTGALIESDLVITTATCLRRLVSRDLSNFVVVLGDSNLREDLPYGIQFHRLTEVVMHPDYLTSGGAHAHDVGVLRLRDHATVSDNVCLVCLAQQDATFPTESCTVTGYGIGDVPRNLLGDVKETVPSEGILRQMSVPILEKPKCQSALHNMTGSEILAHSDSFLCAGGTDGRNACYSTMDGGSPLACEAGGRWFLAGLVSWTRDCQKHDVPNVYTQVSSYSNWLQATHLRMMGFVTHQVYSQQVRWIQEHVAKINKEFS